MHLVEGNALLEIPAPAANISQTYCVKFFPDFLGQLLICAEGRGVLDVAKPLTVRTDDIDINGATGRMVLGAACTALLPRKALDGVAWIVSAKRLCRPLERTRQAAINLVDVAARSPAPRRPVVRGPGGAVKQAIWRESSQSFTCHNSPLYIGA
jgi:hypothetical protein